MATQSCTAHVPRIVDGRTGHRESGSGACEAIASAQGIYGLSVGKSVNTARRLDGPRGPSALLQGAVQYVGLALFWRSQQVVNTKGNRPPGGLLAAAAACRKVNSAGRRT